MRTVPCTLYLVPCCRVESDIDYDPKKDKGASVRLSGVTVSCVSILKREEELKALVVCVPANSLARKK